MTTAAAASRRERSVSASLCGTPMPSAYSSCPVRGTTDTRAASRRGHFQVARRTAAPSRHARSRRAALPRQGAVARSDPLGGRQRRREPRRTGTGARLLTDSATLPCSQGSGPLRSCVAMTTRSALRNVISSRIQSAADPNGTPVSTSNPRFASCSANPARYCSTSAIAGIDCACTARMSTKVAWVRRASASANGEGGFTRGRAVEPNEERTRRHPEVLHTQ
jgi:hypothetical protein